MCTIRLVAVALLSFVTTGVASAAGLSIGAADITWNPAVDGTPSGWMTVELFNDGETNLLGGWLLDLGLQNVSGTGTLQFNARSIEELGTSYILDDDSSGLFGTITNTNITAFDADPGPTIGVTVPASGKYLLAINFKTPDNAQGDWNLVANPGFTGWSDQDQNELAFENVPFDAAEPVVLGTIHVIPEPTSLLLAAIGSGLLVAGALRTAARPRRRGL
jgi:hypothetical protein